MSQDPYTEVKREVEQNLASTRSLLDTYATHDSSTPSSRSQLEFELRETLNLLEADVEDLEESVRIVESTGDRWGLGNDEIRKRRTFVERVKKDVSGLRRKIAAGTKGKAKDVGKATQGRDDGPYRDLPDAERGMGSGDQDEDEQKRWEMEEQQTLIKRQDDTLGFISGTLSTLASQAGLIGHEVNEQSEMLDDLGNRVDNTGSKLRQAQRKMNDFIRRNEETKSGWCICILIFVLIVLLIAVIIT